MQGTAPASSVEEVDGLVKDPGHSVGQRSLVLLRIGGFEGPVDEEGAADDVGARNEAPVTAVEADSAVIAHSEIEAGGNDEILSLNKSRQSLSPFGGDVAAHLRGDGGEVVAIRLVIRVGGLAGVGLVQGNAVAVDNAGAEVDVVAGNTHNALDEEQMLAIGLEGGLVEDDDVAALNVAVVNK